MEKLNKGNVLTATNWNQLVDAARLAVKQVQTGGDVLEWTRQATIVRVRNDSGSDVSRFGVLGVKGGVAIAPTDKLAEFQATPVLTTETLAATHAGKFVVAIEPIANGKIGRAVASGVVVCQVSVTTSGDAFAEAGTGVLTTGATGSARVLYVESGTGTKWAVVRIGEAATTSTFLAKITGNAYLTRASIAIGGGSSIADVEYKWKYAWSEVERASAGTYAAVSGGRSGTTSSGYAINFAEDGNTSQYVWGVDVTGASYPLGFRPRPVGGGGTANTHRVDQIVEMHVGRNTDGTIFFWFDRIGSHDGDCA